MRVIIRMYAVCGKEGRVTPIYDLAERYVEEMAALDPIAATRSGIAGHEARPTDYSPAGFEAIAELDRRMLAELNVLTPQDERDRIARDLMRERIGIRLERFNAGEHFRDLRIIASPFQAPREVFDVQPRTSLDEWQALAARLAAVPAMVEGYLRTVGTGFERRTPPARLQVVECIRQAETWSGRTTGQSAFERIVREFESSPFRNESLLSDLRIAASAAARSYARAADELSPLVAGATEKDAVGRERYLLAARYFTGATLDLEETYSWAWDELHEIERAMDTTAAAILPGGSVPDAIALLTSDPARVIEGVDAYREWLQGIHDEAMEALAGTHFDIPRQIRRVEVLIPPPGGAMAAHYTGPSEDFTRPGRTWWPTGSATRFPKWTEVTTAYHEGVPGHHFEIGLRKCQGESLSRYQRSWTSISGYSEGWALYAERLMGELGYFENPDYQLGLLAAQVLRAVRVIIDIGMHLELTIPAGQPFHPGERWNHSLGLEFALNRGRSEEFMRSELVRYLGWPGQAISYKVGERYWLQAREAARHRMGDSFSLKEFHMAALGLGPMGLDQLRREMAG